MSKLFNEIVLGSLEEGLSTEEAIKRFKSHGMSENQVIEIINNYDFPEINKEKNT
tara:strand:+ start:435 stop:599 length:165 start_codon:yes stop_codon:yes gene_type:complete